MSAPPGAMTVRRGQVLLLGAVLAIVSTGCGGGGTIAAKALLQQSKSLQSVAGEGVLLAQDAVAGKTTRIFTRERSFELSQAASEAEASLKGGKGRERAGREASLAGGRCDASQLGRDAPRRCFPRRAARARP